MRQPNLLATALDDSRTAVHRLRPAPPPHLDPLGRQRPATLGTSALTPMCSPARWWQRLAPDPTASAGPPAIMVADRLLRACGIYPPDTAARQNPLHRETPAIIGCMPEHSPGPPRPDAPAGRRNPTCHARPTAVATAHPDATVGTGTQHGQDPIHREPGDAARAAAPHPGPTAAPAVPPRRVDEATPQSRAAPHRPASATQFDGQNLVHREPAPATIAAARSSATPMGADTASVSGPGQAQSPTSRGAVTGEGVGDRAKPAHDTSDATPTAGAWHVRHPPRHATDGAVAGHRKPIRVHPCASVVPYSAPTHHTDPVAAVATAEAPRGTQQLPPSTHTDAHGCRPTTRSDGKHPMHRETPVPPGLAPATAAHATSGAATDLKRNPEAAAPPAPAAPTATPRPAQPPIHAQDPIHREPPSPASRAAGPLRNGNPRGNPNLAPRCGARTRAGCPCRSPALRGKLRCRMHGGGSTGPRTAEGLQRLRAARTIHGAYSAEVQAYVSFTTSLCRRTRVVLAAMRVGRRLPPDYAARLRANPPELAPPRRLAPGEPIPSVAAQRAAARGEAKALAPWKCAIAAARARGWHAPASPAHPP